jgi:hypothetical protein
MAVEKWQRKWAGGGAMAAQWWCGDGVVVMCGDRWRWNGV